MGFASATSLPQCFSAVLFNYAVAGVLSLGPRCHGPEFKAHDAQAIQCFAAYFEGISYLRQRISVIVARTLVDHVETILLIHSSIEDTSPLRTEEALKALYHVIGNLRTKISESSARQLPCLFIAALTLVKSVDRNVAAMGTWIRESKDDVIVQSIPRITESLCRQGAALVLPRSPECSLFRMLARSASVDSHFDLVAKILLSYAIPSSNPCVESRMLALSSLHLVLTQRTLKLPERFCNTTIQGAVFHNLAWSPGNLAACVRKGALVLLCHILRSVSVEDQEASLITIGSELTTRVVVLLGDPDSALRQLVISCLDLLFERLGGCLSIAVIEESCQHILRCLDDCSNELRVATCGCFQRCLKCAARTELSPHLTEHFVDQLLPHLDDDCEEVHAAVFHTLVAVISRTGKAAIRIERRFREVKALVSAYCYFWSRNGDGKV
eukprot:CAMPEP_0198674106 /NCGR_PEP_ID=MMETSP1467-20131203/97742_1 /TAXON_ID=1462469 /ORGANISM="unid. sp., Strain CCMP2135" /LENGTH=440 /DNA_ID=CAMNT_0044410995 /DNA_START=1351 /DNA_END=2673 /DNA_ORIENTATION=+